MSPTSPAGDAERDALAAYLASAPPELRAWADAQLEAMGADGVAEAAAPPDDPAEPDEDAVDLDDFVDDSDGPVLRRARTARPARVPSTKPRGKQGFGRVNLVLVALLATAVVLLVQQWGGGGQTAQPGVTPTAVPTGMTTFATLDSARVDELKARVAKDAGDVAAMRELGKLYYAAGQWQDAEAWQQKILDLNADDVDALLAIGVPQLNLGDYDSAEKNWLRAGELSPKAPEPWFNLGFLYLSKTPPDKAAATKAWQKVIDVAPDSPLAGTAKTHLKSMTDMLPSASETP